MQAPCRPPAAILGVPIVAVLLVFVAAPSTYAAERDDTVDFTRFPQPCPPTEQAAEEATPFVTGSGVGRAQFVYQFCNPSSEGADAIIRLSRADDATVSHERYVALPAADSVVVKINVSSELGIWRNSVTIIHEDGETEEVRYQAVRRAGSSGWHMSNAPTLEQLMLLLDDSRIERSEAKGAPSAAAGLMLGLVMSLLWAARRALP